MLQLGVLLTATCIAHAGNGTRFRILKRADTTQQMFVTVEHLIRPGAPGWFEHHAGSPPFHSHAQVRDADCLRAACKRSN